MAMQNFYVEVNKPNRASSATMSGKDDVTTCVRMRNNGESICVCNVLQKELEDGKICTSIYLYNENGDYVGCHEVITEK